MPPDKVKVRPAAIDAAEIKRRFGFHAVEGTAAEQMIAVRNGFTNLATTLAGLPEGREKALAFTELEQASFWANAAIARQGAPEA